MPVSKWVLDASAVLAYLRQEPGWQIVDEALQAGKCLMSAINYAEVAAKLAEKGLSEETIRTVLDCLSLQIADFTPVLALASGLLRPATRPFGLSLGDRACLALAMQQHRTVLTADRTWEGLPLEVKLNVIR